MTHEQNKKNQESVGPTWPFVGPRNQSTDPHLSLCLPPPFPSHPFTAQAKMAAAVGGVGAGGVNHVAHLAGALVGVALIWGLSKMLPPE